MNILDFMLRSLAKSVLNSRTEVGEHTYMKQTGSIMLSCWPYPEKVPGHMFRKKTLNAIITSEKSHSPTQFSVLI